YVMAMHDYAPQHQPEDTTCLSFRAGQVIHVLNRDSSGWWYGELEGRRGWFPSNYV
ncbi:SH3 domain-containing protein, partial [Mycena metata]